MYYLNKIIGFLISPIGIAIAGLVFAVVLSWIKRVRLAKWIGGAMVVWLWLWMTPFMTRFVGAPLEREFLVSGRVPAVESFPDADVIVVLGGSMGSDTNLNGYAEMWTSADRVWQAARLWKAGKAPKIIATGDGARESTLGLLKDFGVDEKCVEFLDARNTEEESRVVGEVVFNAEKQRGREAESKILLVTSAWHMRRARMMFEKYAKGVEVLCAPADFEMSMVAKWKFSLELVMPSGYSFMLNSVAFHEWVGIVGYKILR